MSAHAYLFFSTDARPSKNSCVPSPERRLIFQKCRVVPEACRESTSFNASCKFCADTSRARSDLLRIKTVSGFRWRMTSSGIVIFTSPLAVIGIISSRERTQIETSEVSILVLLAISGQKRNETRLTHYRLARPQFARWHHRLYSGFLRYRSIQRVNLRYRE